MQQTSIYLDYAATTPIDPEVLTVMMECYQSVGANPASQHAAGRRARRWLDDVAERLAGWLGLRQQTTPPDRLVFTSGGTEANNLALFGLAGRSPGRAIVATLEHPSVLGAANELERRGWRIDRLRAREDGRVDLEHFDELLADRSARPRFVSLMLANNETGVIQPIAEVVARCQLQQIPVHADAVQAAGKQPIDFAQLGLTTMTIAAHKFHGPVGIGALIVRGQTPLAPQLFGGAQQLGTRPGTESVALVAGLEQALRNRCRSLDRVATHLAGCRDRLQDHLVSRGGAVVNGTAERVPQTLNVSFPGVDRQALLIALDLAGVQCSTGSACASGSSEPSHVLQAMNVSPDRVESGLRLSVGEPTSLAEIDEAAERILQTLGRLRR